MKNTIRFRKAFYKYFISYILLTITLIVSIVLAVNTSITDKMEKELIKEKVTLLDVLKDNLEGTIIKPTYDISLSYVVDAAVNPNSDLSKLMKRGYFDNLYNAWSLYGKLNSVKRQNAFISSIDIYFMDREFIVSSDGFYKNFDNYVRKDLIGILQKTPVEKLKEQWFCTKAYNLDNTGREIYSFVNVFPYTQADTDKTGFICINIDKDTLVGIIKRMTSSSNDSLVILNNNHDVLLSYNVPANREYYNSIIQDISSHKSSGEYDIPAIAEDASSNENRLLYSISDFNQWTYLQISPWKEIVRISTEMKNTIVMILIIILFAGILISWILSKNIYLPVQKIISSLTPESRTSPKDEFVYIDNQIKQLKGDALLLAEELGKNTCLDLLYGKIGRDMPCENNNLFKYDKFIVIILRPNNENTNDEYNYRRVLTERLGEYYHLKALSLDKSHYALILNSNDENEMTEEFIKDYLQVLLKQSECKYTVGIGNSVSDMYQIYESYENAKMALRYEFLKGYNSIISFSEISNTNSHDNIINVKKLTGYVNNGQKSELNELYCQMRENFRMNDYNIEKAEYVFFQLISSLNEIILKTDMHNDFLGYKDLYHMFLKKRTAFEAIDWLEDISENIISLMDSKSSSVKNELMVKLKEYINSHLYEDLSLTRLSQIVYLNPTYLSTQFKQAYGMGALEYINEERLKMAKDLLLKGNKTVEEIAKLVGFPITAYFIKKFKCKYGFTPKNYIIKAASDNMQGFENT